MQPKYSRIDIVNLQNLNISPDRRSAVSVYFFTPKPERTWYYEETTTAGAFPSGFQTRTQN